MVDYFEGREEFLKGNCREVVLDLFFRKIIGRIVVRDEWNKYIREIMM